MKDRKTSTTSKKKTVKTATKPRVDRDRLPATQLAENADIAVEEAEVEKKAEFKMFFIWLSLPSVFIGKDVDELAKLGITDPDQVKLLSIKTMTAFAEEYKVRNATLSEWKKKIHQKGLMEDTKDFFRSLSKNVYGAFYNAIITHGDAHRVRLWEEMFEGKEAEVKTPLPQLLGAQFNTVIINLQDKYDEELRKAYETQIREKRGEVQSIERVHTHSPSGGEVEVEDHTGTDN